MTPDDAAPTIARPAIVLLAAEGRARGFKCTLSFRRFLKKLGVPIAKPSGKTEFVRVADVDAAIERAFGPVKPANSEVAHALAILTGGR